MASFCGSFGPLLGAENTTRSLDSSVVPKYFSKVISAPFLRCISRESFSNERLKILARLIKS
jgi:hypothetical protein